MSDALISECGRYRYWLTREWDPAKIKLVWIMLNPSTADADTDDPTIRRCMSFARDLGFGGIRVMNLFALRATDPKELRKQPSPIGPENDAHLRNLGTTAQMDSVSMVIAAWGTHGKLNRRGEKVAKMITEECGLPLYALKVTADGSPGHPLYVAGDTQPFIWKQKDTQS